MAFVSGLGGGHTGAAFFEKRHSIITAQQENIEDCGCIKFKPKKRKKRSKVALMKERIKQYSIWFFENEDHKEVEHVRRRLERKKKRKLLARKRGSRFVRWLNIFDVLLWIVGIVFTLCSSIKAFGEHSDLYKNKDLFLPLGLGILIAAVLFLCLGTALSHRMKNKHSKPPKRAFYIVQRDKKKSKSDQDIKDPDNDSGNEEDIEMTVFGLQRENYLDTTDGTSVNKGDETPKREDKTQTNSSENISSEKWPNVVFYHDDEVDSQRHQNRRAWAKTKWMRMESYDSDDILDLTENANDEELSDLQEESRETQDDEPPSRLTKASGNRRLTRFKPLSGGCFTAQSSVRSQASTVSFASTTSESAPLVRK